MLTKEEMDFTVNEMLNHAIADIEDFEETEWTLDKLNELKLVINGDQEAARRYWLSQSEYFDHDLERTIKYTCNEIFNGHEIRKSIFRKLL